MSQPSTPASRTALARTEILNTLRAAAGHAVTLRRSQYPHAHAMWLAGILDASVDPADDTANPDRASLQCFSLSMSTKRRIYLG